MESFRGAALNPMGYPHYTDHLAAVCVMMDIPLLFTDVEHFEQARRHYPHLRAELSAWQEFTPESIVPRYNTLFVSDMWSQQQIQGRFPVNTLPDGEHLRVVHCPHGFSDKGFWFGECVDQDITLVYGQNMLDLIAHQRPELQWDRYIVTGNLRYTYYKQHMDRFNAIVEKEVLAQFAQKQPTLLYAPTWRDAEGSSSFFTAAQQILAQLPPSYNLIVKLHPNLEHDPDFMLDVYQVMSQHEERPNVHFLTEFPLIYPLLAACSAYIGDHSAVGYDFLAFNRPLFFLNHLKRDTLNDRATYLFRCGKVLGPDQFEQLFECIDHSLSGTTDPYSEIRQEMYHYSFAAERPFSELRTLVTEACLQQP